MAEKKKSMLLYLDMCPMLEQLGEAGCGRVVLALLHYSQSGEPAQGLNPVEEMAFSFIRAQVDRDMEKYRKRCEQNREIARNQWEKKRAQKSEECERIRTHPNDADTGTGTETETETDTDTDTDTGTDTDTDTGTEPVEKAEPEAPACAAPRRKEGVFSPERLNRYRQAFVENCPSLPVPGAVEEWTRTRKQRLSRLAVSPEEFARVCRMAEESDFLSGRSGKWAGCSLDWLLQPENWQKVREGNYAPRQRPPTAPEVSFDLSEYERETGFFQGLAFGSL